MFIKLLLNILINIAIITLFLSLIWTFNQGFYSLMAGVLVMLALFIFFKIRMFKTVREITRKR